MNVDIEFNYDCGDRSVGLPGGWEDCYIAVEEGPMRFVLGFIPGEGDVNEWAVEYRATEIRRNGRWLVLHSEDDEQKFSTLYVEAPWAVPMVRAEWDCKVAAEATSEASMAVFEIESHISGLEYERDECGDSRPELVEKIKSLQAQLPEMRDEAERLRGALRAIQPWPAQAIEEFLSGEKVEA